MLAGQEKKVDRQEDRLAIVVELHAAELRKKDLVIAKMEAMLEAQALRLVESQRELANCQEALVELKAAV